MEFIKTFIIRDNVNLEVISEFIDFYKNENKSKYKSIKIEILGNKQTANDIIGEIDPIFLSYLVLFLKDFPEYEVEFIFDDLESADRAFSLKDQIEQLNYLLNFTKQLKLKGNYINKTTGEIVPINLEGSLSQSQKFIPLIFIENEADFGKYFIERYSSNSNNRLWTLFYNKLVIEIEERTKQIGEKINSFEIELSNLSFFETCIFNLLLSEEIYKKRNVSAKEKKGIIDNDRNRIRYYEQFVIDISIGIKELAKNIIEHSTEKKGVITCRFFEKDRLFALKGKSENEYLLQITDNFFLDINVVDFGRSSIRETYIKNLDENTSKLINYLGNTLQEDKIIIEKEYEYEDFFTININKFINLEHQQNKLISRYGLHYFTYIIKENYSGFIKTSSSGEGIYIYKKIDNTEFKSNSGNFTKYGTVYNCIIPLNNCRIDKNLQSNFLTNQKRDSQRANTFLELDKYQIIDCKESPRDENVKYSIFKYSGEKVNTKQSQQKYETIVKLFNEIEKLSALLHDSILAIDAENLYIVSESEWVRFLSGISLFFSDIILYNIDISIVTKIINLRRITSKHPFLKFWNNENRVLFYSFKFGIEAHNDAFKRYGATLLTGETENEFNAINQNIWRHHYSFKENIFNSEGSVNTVGLERIIKTSKLFNNGKLLYFELLLKNCTRFRNELSLFEESVQYSLNKRFDVLRNSKTNNKGYKITDTHFRLGSKIHIEDFYYAKRMFQNSFFTIPLSYFNI